MRVFVAAPDPTLAALVAEGLAGVEALCAASLDAAAVAAFRPDAIVVAADRPDPKLIEALRSATAATPRPVAMFVRRSEPGRAAEAMRAGASAYVVDGLTAARVRPVLEVAMSRFELIRGLTGELDRARADLAARKAVERAKALLMKERGLEEDAAYRLLRKLSMDTGRPLGAVAADLLAFAGVLKPDR
jgi:response regulator NasT